MTVLFTIPANSSFARGQRFCVPKSFTSFKISFTASLERSFMPGFLSIYSTGSLPLFFAEHYLAFAAQYCRIDGKHRKGFLITRSTPILDSRM
ncbi:hypothetical protein [Acetomicrobium sp. S15 = DSM 107314]|uniref:hypothetical protein n=1 Tax=Acetomicrobium sp. S15 = DSM 107314 TaxID=2529858 RepID=UPI0018E141B0|nr:hypothetical protein [Acetomicrobium sp. S15 = DSM 107314]